MADQAVKIAALTAFLFFSLVSGAGKPSFAQMTKAEQVSNLIEAGSVDRKQAAPPELISRPVLEYQSEGLRDPFLDYLPEKQEAPAQQEVKEDFANKLKTLEVQGIIWGSGMPQAIVNNQVIRAGDMFEGARVISIEKSGINLMMDDKEYKLGPPSASGVSTEKY
ncbi:MAG: hypothetical protein Q8O22_03005 [Candidatus Omnitrophota bacterium]|nr:hypothetical protein [Candidatus Omnitrophota bacterium]